MISHMLLQILALIEDAGIVDEKAQTLVEYALILLLIAIVVVGALTLFGTSLRDYYQLIVDAFP